MCMMYVFVYGICVYDVCVVYVEYICGVQGMSMVYVCGVLNMVYVVYACFVYVCS